MRVGNFLTETYLSLRKLENRVLEDLYGDQMVMGLDEPVQVQVSQFYGIEINDFAVEVAKIALWIAELQMLDQTREILSMWIDPLPLKTNSNIACGNALRMDWGVLPAGEASYVIGNPPFLGHSNLNSEQKADRASIFGDVSTVDYVACWYAKASEYTKGHHARSALVSTNSICQGQQVKPIWDRMFAEGNHIDFCWRTFIWNNEATDQAHVHCVIVGFSREEGVPKTILRRMVQLAWQATLTAIWKISQTFRLSVVKTQYAMFCLWCVGVAPPLLFLRYLQEGASMFPWGL